MRRQKSNATKSQSTLKRSNHVLSKPRKKKRIQALRTRKAKRSLEALDIQDESTEDNTDEDMLSEYYSSDNHAVRTKPPKRTGDAHENMRATLDQPDQQPTGKYEDQSLDTSVAFITLRFHYKASKHQFQQIVKKSEARAGLPTSMNLQPDQSLSNTNPDHDSSSNDPQAFKQWLGIKFDNLNAQIQDFQQQTLERVDNLQKEQDSRRDNAAETAGDASDEDDVPVRAVRKLTRAQWGKVDRMFPGSSRPQEQGGESSSAHTVESSKSDNMTAPQTRSRLRQQGRTLRYSTRMTSGLDVICEQD